MAKVRLTGPQREHLGNFLLNGETGEAWEIDEGVELEVKDGAVAVNGAWQHASRGVADNHVQPEDDGPFWATFHPTSETVRKRDDRRSKKLIKQAKKERKRAIKADKAAQAAGASLTEADVDRQEQALEAKHAKKVRKEREEAHARR